MEKRIGTTELLALEVGRALESLETLFTPEEIQAFFSDLGLEFGPDLLVQASFTNALNNARSAATGLVSTLGNLAGTIEAEDVTGAVQRALEMINTIRALIDAVDNLATQINALAATLAGVTPADVQAFAASLTKRLLEYMLLSHLEGYYPLSFRILALLGLVEYVGIAGDPTDPAKPPHTRKELRFDKLGDLVRDPGNVFEILYGWGTPAFNGDELLSHIGALLSELDLMVGPEPDAGEDEISELYLYWVRLASLTGGAGGLEARLEFPVPDKLTASLPLLFDGWSLELDVRGALGEGLRVQLSPPAELTFIPPSPDSVQGSMSLRLVGAPEDPSKPFLLLGQADGSRLELTGVKAGFGADFKWNSSANKAEGGLMFEAGVDRGRLVLSPSGADGFLASILPSEGFQSEFDFLLKVSESGVYIEGSATLEIKLAVHVELGPIRLDGLYLIVSLQLGNNVIPIEVSTAITTELGPLTAAVDRLGFLAEFSFPGSGGNLGPLDVKLKFKPPNGVGLAINTGVVKGGGYLYFDFEKEEYAGALELVFNDFLTLKAIGLITTRMPDGSKGFSLLIIITAEFGSPIQLGFGFTLNGVGGLLGLNRTMRLEVLAEGVRTGAVESVMFPRDVIENAPRIISDLREFFPPAQDIFLIGPMAKLGWGTPTLVSASLGVIIQIPPGNIAILGVLKVALPDEDAALIILQVNFIGALEFDKKRMWFFAAMYESRVIFITLEGELGLLIAWGADANFVLSVGGFHPSFNPPPMPFLNPKRVSVSILNESFAKVMVMGYFAVTSNTAQFGARVEVFFGLSAFGIEGHLGFDALFQFSPFYFIITISASLGVKVFGVGLFSVHMRGELEGTSPWHIEGEGSISLLFWSIDVPFSHTWGQDVDTTLPSIQVMPLLEAEFNKLSNWTAEVPKSSNLLVSLRKIESTEDLVLHPVGVLRVSQRAVPLDLNLDKVGNQKPSDVKKIVIDVPGSDLQKHRDAKELFATAQFKELSDSKKLSSPAYEKQESGVELSTAGPQLNSDAAVKRVVRYEEIIIDSNFKEHVKRFVVFAAELFAHFIRGNAVSRSLLSATYKSQKAPIDQKIAVETPMYVVASNANNTAFSADAQFTSQVKADDFLQEQINQDPNLAESLHVIPATELKEAA